jgi:hypothetical protein
MIRKSWIWVALLVLMVGYLAPSNPSEASRFCSVNTGLPSGAEKNEILRMETDCFKLYNRAIKMRSFDFWVEAKYSNRLALAGAEFDVPALLGDSGGKSLVRLTIVRMSLGCLIWNHLRP